MQFRISAYIKNKYIHKRSKHLCVCIKNDSFLQNCMRLFFSDLSTLNVKVKNGLKSKKFFMFEFKKIHFDIFSDHDTLIKSGFTP